MKTFNTMPYFMFLQTCIRGNHFEQEFAKAEIELAELEKKLEQMLDTPVEDHVSVDLVEKTMKKPKKSAKLVKEEPQE